MPKRSASNAITFAGRLRDLRERAGLTVSELARAADLPQPTVYRYETGEIEPTLSRLVKLAKALGVSLGDLAAG